MDTSWQEQERGKKKQKEKIMEKVSKYFLNGNCLYKVHFLGFIFSFKKKQKQTKKKKKTNLEQGVGSEQ